MDHPQTPQKYGRKMFGFIGGPSFIFAPSFTWRLEIEIGFLKKGVAPSKLVPKLTSQSLSYLKSLRPIKNIVLYSRVS